MRASSANDWQSEHSHEPILTSVRASLNINNPLQIVDPVFALLGDAAAAQGAGQVTVRRLTHCSKHQPIPFIIRIYPAFNKQLQIKPSLMLRLPTTLR